MKELSDNACNCIDTIDSRNKSKSEFTKEVHKCIDDQAGAYQLGSQLMNINLSDNKESSKKDTINITINTNKNSSDYLTYYNKIESFLMENCEALKKKLGSNDIENPNSVSDNPKSIKEYSKGLKYFKKENYKTALKYFEKAVKIDSVFTFAWDNIGLCQRRLENFDAAITAYKKSIELDPLGIMPLQNIAIAYEYKKEYNNAIDAYNTLSQLDSFNPEVFYGLGRIQAFDLFEYEKGLDNICKAYNLYLKQKSPYKTDAIKLINMIYPEMKKLDKVDRFKEILKENDINANFE
ncbi:MAG: tetratricopeptide repeat protein [Paludibacter sp.]|nr:tetratricopeptide repeat protein [Paludibacter sp.]